MVGMNAVTGSDPVSLDIEASDQIRRAREADAHGPDVAERRRIRTLRGLADVDAGRVIDDIAMQVWAESLGTDSEQPAP